MFSRSERSSPASKNPPCTEQIEQRKWKPLNTFYSYLSSLSYVTQLITLGVNQGSNDCVIVQGTPFCDYCKTMKRRKKGGGKKDEKEKEDDGKERVTESNCRRKLSKKKTVCITFVMHMYCCFIARGVLLNDLH